MTRYRFTPEDFYGWPNRQEGWRVEQERLAEHANAKLAEWEAQSQKIYGSPNPKTQEIQIWTPKGPHKLLRADYTHIAVIWNPRKFEEVK